MVLEIFYRLFTIAKFTKIMVTLSICFNSYSNYHYYAFFVYLFAFIYHLHCSFFLFDLDYSVSLLGVFFSLYKGKFFIIV